MVNYRRAYIEGGMYFFTVTLKNRQQNYLTTYVDALRDSFAYVKKHQPFEIIAIVILPEHLHCLWHLPRGDDNYAGRWRAIKSRFTRALIKSGADLHKNKRGEYNLWQSRYWEHSIRDESDLLRHIDYIHYNPVKHGYVDNVKDWSFSSFHQFVEEGTLPQNWGLNINDSQNQYGE
ncbi:MAG: transposase [Methylococcales bacterium]|nr:transposase [Methylococcales bacterium]